ncbi:MAG: metallophosphoesterase family protein, partial [Heliobacteriaceae bacterium]|nr:metallophosphoesterase family protein [Heliobacteriaceae bacterium]
MRYAIMADVHGRERELVKALQLTEPDDRIVFLGDVPDYRSKDGMLGCLMTLQQHKVRGIRGNCDNYVLNFYERPPEVDPAIWDFYRSWPEKYAEGEVLFVHGSPRNPLAERIDSVEKAWRNFQVGDFNVCFHGHRHRLTCFECLDQDVRLLPLT